MTLRNSIVERFKIGEIPVLACFDADRGFPKPLVIISHGFRGSKENLRERAAALAKLGYYAVAIDNCGHGERPGPGFLSQVSRDGALDMVEVRRLIKETADDIPAIVDYFAGDKLINGQRVGLVGVSMGGFVTFRALTFEKRIKVAAPIIASPFWDDLPAEVPVLSTSEARDALTTYARRYSPAHYPDQFFPRPLLIQIGEVDQHYNGAKVKRFYHELQGRYRSAVEKVQLIVHEGVGHTFTEPMWVNAVNWLQKYLQPKAST